MERNRTSSLQSKGSILSAFVIVSSAVFTGGVNAEVLKQSDEGVLLHGFKLSAPFSEYSKSFCTPSFIHSNRGTKGRICTSDDGVGVALEITRSGRLVSISSFEYENIGRLIDTEALKESCQEVVSNDEVLSFTCDTHDVHWTNSPSKVGSFQLELCEPSYCVTVK